MHVGNPGLDIDEPAEPAPLLAGALPRTSRSRRLRHSGFAITAVGAAIGLWYLLELAALQIPVTADGATALLEGQSIAGGNLTLHGWSLSLDSFWAIDAVAYGIVERIVGLHIDLLHLVPALLAVAVIVVGVVLGRDGRRGLGGLAGGAVVVALLAFPNPDLAYYLLQGPWHIGTALYCLVAFGLLRHNRFDWRWGIAIALFALGLLSDLLIVTFGVAAAMAAGVLAMARHRHVRAGTPTLLAGIGGILGAFALRWIVGAIGTFTIVNRNLVLRSTQLRANFGHLGNRIPGLFGIVNIPLTGVSNGPTPERVIHVLGLVVVVAALGVAIIGVVSAIVRAGTDGGARTEGAWRIDDLLVLAVLADLATFVFASANGHVEFAKYLTPGVIFAVVLAARTVARLVDRCPNAGARIAITVAAMAMALAYGACFVANLNRPPATQNAARLASYLSSHHLTEGIGDYPTSSIITVDTGGAVQVRPVASTGEHLARFNRQTTTEWYTSTRFHFLVYNSANVWHGVDRHSGIATFGRPNRTVRVGTYLVLIWTHPFTVSVGSASYGSPLNIKL